MQGQKYMTRHTHLQYADTNAQVYPASAMAARQTFIKYTKKYSAVKSQHPS